MDRNTPLISQDMQAKNPLTGERVIIYTNDHQ